MTYAQLHCQEVCFPSPSGHGQSHDSSQYNVRGHPSSTRWTGEYRDRQTVQAQVQDLFNATYEDDPTMISNHQLSDHCRHFPVPVSLHVSPKANYILDPRPSLSCLKRLEALHKRSQICFGLTSKACYDGPKQKLYLRRIKFSLQPKSAKALTWHKILTKSHCCRM